MRRRFAKLLRNTSGNVAIMFGLAAFPIVGIAGVAVDYTRAARVEAELQAAVDSAALAGATQTSDSAIQSTVEATVNGNLLGGLEAFHATYDLEIAADSVTVTAAADVPATLTAIFRSAIPVDVLAQAAFGEPVRTVNLSVTEFNSSAWDANQIYWYIIPEDGGVPPEEDMHLLLSNDPDNPAPDGPQLIQMGVNQRIGFALVNVTGGVRSYGNNSYGQPPGSVHTFYSHLEPENLASSGVADCATGTVIHGWDDNGGGVDDNDFDDAVYEFDCETIQTDPTTVVLIR
jgi:Flp pilus assembly protein TadG